MKPVLRVALILCTLAIAPFALAAEFEADDGPWINVDVIDLASAGDASYLEYLGKGYVALLDAIKTEGLIIDYGVMMKTTGNAGDGDVVVWWSVETLAGYEKALERVAELAGTINSAEEWQEIWTELEKVRTMRSSNLYRAMTWSKVEE